MVGDAPAMRELRARVFAVAQRRCTVLVRGETGTGKELVARHIHAGGMRRYRPFVPVDCSTLPQTLFESQIFGHVKGAFTGAQQNTLGFIRSAEGGTLFLDEIGELPLAVQAKLLRCIQERTVVPVGASRPIPVDVRIIAATHRDLHAMVDAGTFRQDLYYRLDVAQIQTPPLRDRGEDIPTLVGHFIDELARLYDEPAKRIGPGLIDVLVAHDWRGNIRELSNAIEHAFIFGADGQILPDDLPDSVTHTKNETSPAPLGVIPLAQAESELIARALRAVNGNQTRASALMGIERHRLRRKIVRYGLEELTNPRPQ
jgi:transcriptional regulator with PAS, ATPase and Fis domain